MQRNPWGRWGSACLAMLDFEARGSSTLSCNGFLAHVASQLPGHIQFSLSQVGDDCDRYSHGWGLAGGRCDLCPWWRQESQDSDLVLGG